MTHNLKKLLFSFRCALRGIIIALKEERNLRIQSILSVFIICLSAYLHISQTELMFVVFSIALVIGAEIVNTAIEDLCNKVEPHHDDQIGKIKDMMAGFVLTISLASIVIASIIFVPKLLSF